jgi:hypothetical protein
MLNGKKEYLRVVVFYEKLWYVMKLIWLSPNSRKHCKELRGYRFVTSRDAEWLYTLDELETAEFRKERLRATLTHD